MTTTWTTLQRLFDEVVALPEEERRPYLDRMCGSDEGLRAELETLLAADAGADGVLEGIVDDVASRVPRAAGKSAEVMSSGGVAGVWVGRRLGPWLITGVIDEGGMGVVYRAVRADDAYRQEVAVKIAKGRAARGQVDRLLRERQALADLDHPHIARLLDGGATPEGQHYIVMEYIEGEAIDTWCARRRLSLTDRLELFRTVCGAVQHAHRNLIVHRDIKPANVLVTRDGVPKLLDFGIAKLLGPDRPATVTVDHPMTPQYASPEQLRGQVVTTATDVYSLGVLLYELLVGIKPFGSATTSTHEILRRICEEEPERPSAAVRRRADLDETIALADSCGWRPDELGRCLEGDLDTIMLMALRKDPETRYASVERLSHDIGRHLEGHPIEARSRTFGYRAAKFVRRNRMVVVATTMLVIALAIGFVGREQALARERSLLQQRQDLMIASLDLFKANPNLRQGSAEYKQLEAVLDSWAAIITKIGFDGPEEEIAALEALVKGYDSLRQSAKVPAMRQRILGLLLSLPERDDRRIATALARVGKHEEALALRRSIFTEPHREIAESLFALGARANSEGRTEEARDLHRRAREMMEACIDVPDTRFVNMLASEVTFLHTVGDNAAALELVERAVELARGLRPADPYRTAAVLGTRGWLLQDINRFDEALADLEESETLFGSILSPDHPQIANALHNRGLLLKDMVRYEDALRVLQEAFQIVRAAYPEEPDNLHSLQCSLAKLHADWGRWDDAIAPARISHDSRASRYGVGNMLTSESATLLGRVLIHNGRAKEALPLLEQAHEVREARMTWERWERHKTRSILGACYARLGRYEEAEPLLLESYPLIKADRGDGDRRTVQACERIVELYELWARPEEATRWRAELPAGAQLTHLGH